jgi:hypothetical protein
LAVHTAVIGTLSGFDRLLLRGTLRFLSHTAGIKGLPVDQESAAEGLRHGREARKLCDLILL